MRIIFDRLRTLLFSTVLVGSVAGLPVINLAHADVKADELVETVDASNLSGSFLAARSAARANDDVAAVAFFERALGLDPDNQQLKNQLFLALVANGRIDDAVAMADDITPDASAQNIVNLVVAVDELRKRSWKKADQALEGINGSDLDNLMVGLLKSWSIFGSGEYEQALANADNIEGPDWISVVRDYHVGLMASAKGEDGEAVSRITNVIENEAAAAILTQVYVRSLETGIRLHTRSGDWDAAAKVLERAYRLFPSHPPFGVLNTAVIKRQAMPPLITTPQQGAAELFFDVGTAIGRNDQTQFSRTYLQVAHYLDNKSDVIAMALASVLENQKDHARANEYYEKIGKESAFYRRAQLESALNLNQLERKEEAEERLRELVAADPTDLIGSLTLGQLLNLHEKYREAADVYDAAAERLTKVENYHWNLFYRRGIAYERLKEWEKAEPNFKKALELYPNQPDVLNYLGYSWIDMGIHLEEGLDMIRKAVELKPQSGFIIDSLGWAHYRLGDYEDAVRELERAVELMPEDPTINDHLGDAYWKVGRKLEATFQWRHALTSDPTPELKATIEAKLENGLVEDDDEATAKTDN